MSLEALNWALRQQVLQPSLKVVLILLGNYANDRGVVYPSVATLASASSLSDDTVRRSLKALVESGIIEDTGKKAGNTQQIRVYRLPFSAWSEGEQAESKGTHDAELKDPQKTRRRPAEDPHRPGPSNVGTGTGTVLSAEAQKHSRPESLEECIAYGREIQLPKSECEAFFDFFSSNGWKISGRAPMKDWKAAMRNWKRNSKRNRSVQQTEFIVGASNP